MIGKTFHQNARGSVLVEFALVSTVFITALFAVLEFGRMLWIHNALRDAARRGARYAITRKNDAASMQAVRNVVIYGRPNPTPGSAPLVSGLTANRVNVEYSNFGGVLLSSKATVSITGYQFRFIVPIAGASINMPDYRSTLPGESAGFIPCNISSARPFEPCSIIPE